MPKKRSKSQSESTPIVAVLLNTDHESYIRQYYPRARTSRSIGKPISHCHRPRSIFKLGDHLYIYTTLGNHDEKMEFQRMQLSKRNTTWSILTPMPTPRDDFAVSACDGKIYFVGGSKEELQPSNTVQRYCPDNDVWETINSLLEPRCFSCLVVCQGRLYCVGGACCAHRTASNAVQMFDPGKTNELAWKFKQQMLLARMHFAAVAIGEKIYALGGMSSVLRCSLYDVEMYNVADDSWTKFEEMHRSRDHFCACVYSGKIFIAGGLCHWPDIGDDDDVSMEAIEKWYADTTQRTRDETEMLSGNVPCVEMYDFEKGAWEHVTPTKCTSTTYGTPGFIDVL